MSCRRLLIGFGVLLTLAGGSTARAASSKTFYVSPNGNDRANGRSPNHAWRTISRVDNAQLSPGDIVLFEAKATFTDATLTPPSSGAPGAPIVFGSYGPGMAIISNPKGAVWFSGRSYVTFQNLLLTTGNADGVIFAGSNGVSTHVTLRNSILRDSNYAAINQPSSHDSNWLIRNNLIQHVGDSGLLLSGFADVVWGNTIKDVGWNPALNYGKHGIYSKGRDILVAHNRIMGFPNGSGVSLRYSNARVIGNSISYGSTAISSYHEDAQIGTSYVIGNRISAISRAAFYYDVGGGENFVVSGNTFKMAGGTGLDVQGKPASKLSISGNTFIGSFDYAISSQSIVGSSVYTEFKNAFAGDPRFAWGGRSLNYQQYRASSGQGSGDRVGLASN
jgi:hypothetical protein